MRVPTVVTEAARVYKGSVAILLVSLAGGLFAGSFIGTEGVTETFADYPGLLLLLPAFLATRGNVYGALGARISTGLHQGLIQPRFGRDRRLMNAVAASLINGITVSVFIGFMSWGILTVLGRDSAALYELVGVTLVAGLLTSVVMIVGLLTLVFGGYRRGVDPDNLVGPVVTTLGDMFGVVFLYVGVVVVEVLG